MIALGAGRWGVTPIWLRLRGFKPWRRPSYYLIAGYEPCVDYAYADFDDLNVVERCEALNAVRLHRQKWFIVICLALVVAGFFWGVSK